MKTAYAYARFSSDNQREESIDAQLRAISEFCDMNNIRILRIFKDEAFSARTDKRPAFQELFGLIKDHPADLLIVHKLDRFARNRADAAFYRQKLKEAGMKLVSVLERLDDAPESIILEGVLESINEYYSANLARETKKGMRENAMKGVRNGGKAPIGYMIEKQHLIPNKDADKVKELFRMYADGASYKEMTEFSGIDARNIYNIFNNQVYLGHLVSGDIIFKNAHNALVDQATWDLCQKRLKAHLNAANRARVNYLLSGVIICGTCGKRMHGYTSNGHSYYGCRTKGCKNYRKKDLEERVINELQKAFVPTAEIKAKFYRLVCDKVNSRAKIEEANKANSALSKRISKLLNAVQYADAESAEYLLNQVKDLKSQMVKVPKPVEVSKEACDALIDTFANISEMSDDEKKSILRQTLDCIIVKEDSVDLVINRHRGLYVTITKGRI